MGLLDKICAEFIDIIEWTDNASDMKIWRFPRYQVDQFVVNGRNGQITGDYPKSTAKIVSIVLAVIVVIWVLYYFFG